MDLGAIDRFQAPRIWNPAPDILEKASTGAKKISIFIMAAKKKFVEWETVTKEEGSSTIYANAAVRLPEYAALSNPPRMAPII